MVKYCDIYINYVNCISRRFSDKLATFAGDCDGPTIHIKKELYITKQNIDKRSIMLKAVFL